MGQIQPVEVLKDVESLWKFDNPDRRKFRSQTSDNMDRWKSQRWEESERRTAEEERSEKRKGGKKEDGARKGRKVEIHYVFPMICGSGGSKSRLVKGVGAETSGEMRDEKLHAVAAQSTFPSQNVRSTFGSWDVEKVHVVEARSTVRRQNVQNTPHSDRFWKLRCQKSARRCGVKHISRSKCYKHYMFGPLLDVQMSFRMAGARDCAPCQKREKRDGFPAFPTTMAGVGHLKRIWKDPFSVAGAVQETCSSEMLGGQGAEFLRGVAFWSIRSSVLRGWFCVTGINFVWPGITFWWLEKSQNALVRGRQLCIQVSIVEGSLAQLLRFWCCQLQKLSKSRRIASFLMLPTSKIEAASQHCFLFDVIKFKSWRSLAELLRFQTCR